MTICRIPSDRASSARALPVALSLLGLSLAACEDSSVGTQPSPVGEWRLVEFAGEELPVVLAEEGGVFTELTEGSLFIARDRGCTFQLVTVTTQPHGDPSTVADSAECTWSRTRDTLVLTFAQGDRVSALLEPGRLTLQAFVFRR